MFYIRTKEMYESIMLLLKALTKNCVWRCETADHHMERDASRNEDPEQVKLLAVPKNSNMSLVQNT